MNSKFVWLTKLGLEVLGLGLLAYMASRTLDFVSLTMPDDKQYWGYLFLLATGIGAVIWAGVYLTFARGMKQRGTAFAMGIVDLLGELGLVYADTQYVASQSGKVEMTPDELNTFILLSIGMIGINAVAYYFFKLFDPDAENEQNAQDLVDQASAAAIRNLNTPEARQRMIAEHSPALEAAIMRQVEFQITAQVGRITNGTVIVVPQPTAQPSEDPTVTPSVPAKTSPFPISSLSEVSDSKSPFRKSGD